MLRQPRLGLGGVRRTSLLHEIIDLETMLLGLLGTTVALTEGFSPVPNGSENRWLAAASAGMVVRDGAAAIFIIRQVWLPWLQRRIQPSRNR